MDEFGVSALTRSYFVYNSFKFFLIYHHSLDIFLSYTKTIR